MRRRLADLRAEWNAIHFAKSRSIMQPVCQIHQSIVASALTKFVVDAKVSAIFSHNNTHAARRIIRELNAAGYKIVKVRAH
jgi:soluble P-type ATPase